MSQLDRILKPIKLEGGKGYLLIGDKQAIKDLFFQLLQEVKDEQLHVGGDVNGNQLVSEGFYKHARAIKAKVEKL